jgi:phage baseplate assembly protein W
MATKSNSRYSDLNLGFIAHPVTGAVARKTDREAVKQSVRSLILTDFYERPFQPEIGCGLRYSLFELFTPATKQAMETAIREVIENYEPRASILEVLVEDHPDDHAMTASIAFMIVNDPNPIVLDLILERVR